MFDVGFGEIVLTSFIALVVLGPEKLPKVARQVGNWMGRARIMARQLTEQLEREVNAEELLKAESKRPGAAQSSWTPQSTAGPPSLDGAPDPVIASATAPTPPPTFSRAAAASLTSGDPPTTAPAPPTASPLMETGTPETAPAAAGADGSHASAPITAAAHPTEPSSDPNPAHPEPPAP